MTRILSLLSVAALVGVPLASTGAAPFDSGPVAALERPLDLGGIVQSGQAGTVSVSPQGVQTCTAILCLGGAHSGIFGIRGTADTLIHVSASPAVLRNGRGSTMVLQPRLSTNAIVLPSGRSRGGVAFGGTLQVPARQDVGDYAGEFDLTLEYQ